MVKKDEGSAASLLASAAAGATEGSYHYNQYNNIY